MSKKIFILEDDENIRELIQYLLESEGYTVSSFASVESFNEQIACSLPDLVVLDIWLPDGDGRKVCRSLRKNHDLAGLPIVMMTASSLIGAVDGATDFIAKPFDVNDFVVRIERLLSA